SFGLRQTERRGALARSRARASNKGHPVAAFARVDLRWDSAPNLFSRTTSDPRIHSGLFRNDANARRDLHHLGLLPRQSSPTAGNCGHRSDCCRSDGAPRSTTGRTSQLIGCKMKFIRWVVVICVVVLLVYGASPYFSFWRFTATVQSRDAAAISARVDFPA